MHLAALVFFSALAAPVAQSAPDNFAIILTYGCPGQSIDTANGTFTRQIDANVQAVAKVTLTTVELRHLAEVVDRIAFFDMPKRLRDQSNLDGTITVTSGSLPTRLEVRTRGRTHTVEYDASSQGTKTTQVENYLALVREIIHLYMERPEVKRLPEPQIFCL